MLALILLLLLVLLAVWNLVVGIVVTALVFAVLVWGAVGVEQSALDRHIRAKRRPRKGPK